MAVYDYATSQIKIHVIDTGKGIDADEMETVFEQFGKIERHKPMNNDGIGLGLSICKHIVS